MSHPSVPAKSIKEVIELAKKEPGKLTVGTPPSPTLNFFGAENFKAVTGTDITIVTYKGTGPLTNDLSAATSCSPSTRCRRRSATSRPASSRHRGRGAGAARRHPGRADGRRNPACRASISCSITGSRRRPARRRPVVERLNKELRAIVTSDDFKTRIVADGGGPVAGTPEEYAANIAREEGKWAAIIKKLGLKVE